MAAEKLRIAIVGCGQIADAHMQEINKIRGTHVVGVCDHHPDLARQLSKRYGGPAIYSELSHMLQTSRPQVLHVTTPPHTHYAIARQSLEAGVHVYIEKPFSLNALEAVEVMSLAKERKLLACVGHDQLFDPLWIELRKRIAQGELGEIVHIDSIMGYNLSGPFGRVMAGDPNHWIHRLPGGLIQNNISHAVYKITDFLPDDRPAVSADWFGVSEGFPSELRVMVRGNSTTANILFSSTIRPLHRIARIYGTRSCVEADLDGQVLRWSRPGLAPGPFSKIEKPLVHFLEAGRAFARNCWRFFRSDLQYFGGMNRLFRDLYKAIQTGGSSPIPASEIIRVTSIMDDIICACNDSTKKHRENLTGSTMGGK